MKIGSIDISRAFRIEHPGFFTTWDFRRKVEHAFADLSSRCVTDGYYTAGCTSLGRLAALG
jgi:hypothetical protein